jgi:hypothetical protein
MTRPEEVFDAEVVSAVREAVQEDGGSDLLAERVLAWLQAVARGESSVRKPSDVEEHYQALAAAIEDAKEEER